MGIILPPAIHADIISFQKVFVDFKNGARKVDNDIFLILSVLEGNGKQIQSVLEKGANVNFQTKSGLSSLMIAALNNETDIISLLLEHGADIDLASNDGGTALMLATINERREAVELLANNGADPARLDKHKNSAVFMAADIARKTGDVTMLKILKEGIQVSLEKKYLG